MKEVVVEKCEQLGWHDGKPVNSLPVTPFTKEREDFHSSSSNNNNNNNNNTNLEDSMANNADDDFSSSGSDDDEGARRRRGRGRGGNGDDGSVGSNFSEKENEYIDLLKKLQVSLSRIR